ncbi:MAG: ComF family protein [bacterium]|nr:ComF family protein [bacterium]MCP4799909.1 ComF family protein [bacterium]
MNIVAQASRLVLDIIYPDNCCLCEQGDDILPCGGFVRGLRWCDSPHLCTNCFHGLSPIIISKTIAGIPMTGGMNSCANLVKMVSEMKYHGIRGLAWPLADLIVKAVEKSIQNYGEVDVLVPVPMHKSRRRERGFNQAELLAELVSLATGINVENQLVSRERATVQQAKIDIKLEDRRENISGCYKLLTQNYDSLRIGIIDDLITSGATTAELVNLLRESGLRVQWVAAAGIVKL